MDMFKKFEEIGFNVKDAVDRLGSEDIFLALIPSFIDDIKLNMSMLMDSLNERKLDDCIRILHSLKGVAATLSHDSIRTRTEILEEEIVVAKGSEEIGTEIIDWLKKETEQYIEYCSEIVKKIT